MELKKHFSTFIRTTMRPEKHFFTFIRATMDLEKHFSTFIRATMRPEKHFSTFVATRWDRKSTEQLVKVSPSGESIAEQLVKAPTATLRWLMAAAAKTIPRS